jgi:WLM domain
MATGDTNWLSQAQNVFQNLQQSLGVGNSQYPLVQVKSSIDGKLYRVRDMRDKQQAADLLAKVRLRMKKLYAHLSSTFPDKPQVKRLLQRFEANPERLLEATPDAEHTSYSVNKGESVHLCLRQRQGADENLVNENVMVFVSLHEMAHMITDSVGHEPEFWNNFGWLLKQAENLGVYQYQDFKAHPVRYCGTNITDQPRYDPAKDGNNMTIGSISFD